jgi:hypothetical protein
MKYGDSVSSYYIPPLVTSSLSSYAYQKDERANTENFLKILCSFPQSGDEFNPTVGQKLITALHQACHINSDTAHDQQKLQYMKNLSIPFIHGYSRIPDNVYTRQSTHV